MNILVCVKQVPDTNEIKIDPETNTLVRDGVPSIVNTFDGYALEAAARVKDNNPDTKIVVLSMGPAQAGVPGHCRGQGLSAHRPGLRRVGHPGHQLHSVPGHPEGGEPGGQV